MLIHKIHRGLIHTYMFSAILGIFCFIPLEKADLASYNVGASSWLVALGLASGGAVSKPLGIFLSVWVILLPILLVIFYIMALKDIDIPFFILTCIDTTIVLFWYIGCMLNANTYTIESAQINAIVSIIFTVIFAVSLYLQRRIRDGSVVPSFDDNNSDFVS